MLLDSDSVFALTLLIIVLTLGIIWYYKKRISIYSDFPSVNFLFLSIKYALTSKISKHIPATSYFFRFWIDACKKYQSEGVCLIWILQPYLFIFNEEALKVFSNENSSIDKPFNFEIFREFWGTNMLTSGADLWKKRRKIFNPLFYKSLLKDHTSIMNKNATVLVKRLAEHSKEASINVIPFLKVCAFLNVYEFLSGKETNKYQNYSEVEELIDAVSIATEMVVYRVFKPWLHPKFMMPFFAKGRTFMRKVKKGHQIAKKLLDNIKEPVMAAKREKNNELDESHNMSRQSFAQLILEHHMKDPAFTSQDMQDEFNGLLSAGYDTVSYALMWSLFLLGHHPEIQDRTYEEVESVMGPHDNLLWDDLQNLKYLECVIKESLRLYPPIPIFGRYLEKDVQFGKYKVPKGTNIAFFLYLSGRDPKTFPDPEKFDPDRFLEENSEQKLLTYTFAEGARNCIGKKFALIELKIVLAHLIKNFKVTSLDEMEDVQLSWEIVLTTVKPLRMRLTPRDYTSIQD